MNCNYVSMLDIDECTLGIDNCNQTCLDTEGTYTCSCNSAYHLNSDGRTCDGKFFNKLTAQQQYYYYY